MFVLSFRNVDSSGGELDLDDRRSSGPLLHELAEILPLVFDPVPQLGSVGVVESALIDG